MLLNFIQYKYSIIIENTTTGAVYDISKAFENAVWTTHRHASQPGTLEVTIKEGIYPADMIIHEGSFITFGINGTNYFYGRVQSVELISNGEEGSAWCINAYNSFKLLNTVENSKREHGATASDFFQYLMDKYSYIGLRGAVLEPSSIPLERNYYIGESLFNMIDDSLRLTHSKTHTEHFMIRDNLGIIEFRELSRLRTAYILGDDSFVNSYTYTANINTDTYNVIKGVRMNNETGFIDVWQVHDSLTRDRFGHKQKTIDIMDNVDNMQIDAFISLVLEAKNRPVRSARLTAIGINGLQAGDGIQVRINKKSIDHFMPINTITHVYSPTEHVMDMELAVQVV